MDDQRADNLRTEYSALVAYYSSLITFRFTTVGFFLAAAALIVQVLGKGTALLLLLLTVGAWVIELRNRAIFRALLDRAVQIEEDWQHQGRDQFSPLFRRMVRIGLSDELRASSPEIPKFLPDKVKIFCWEWRPSENWVSHSFGLDLIYGAVLVFALAKTFHTWLFF